ncbi:MAG: hypothetical protein LBD06_04560 [Candidatus Accumulibacter sp.]|jgi:hypothetical protein|nr:hypothetical protein [Accumulibacter sp.]
MHIRPFLVAGVWAFAGVAGAALSATDAGSERFYCCTNAAGKYICGDIVPPSCYGRAYRELGANGRTVREIAAPLTAEQRAQRAAEEEQRRKDAVLQKEQQRKDQALLETYISVDDIEVMRKRALDDVHQSIRNAEDRIAEIQALRKKYENEAEFYQKKAPPPEIEKGLADTEFEIKAQEAIIEAKKKDLTALQGKFDEDRRRFLDLQHRHILPPQ